MSPTLLVLAAGMGSRYGGLKQIDPVGPTGETVLDYAVFDAVRAGFKRVVFVIREDFADTFKAQVAEKYADKIAVDYVYQSLAALPEGSAVPAGREKPWGTGHAVWCAREAVGRNFAVINADDFYGADSFAQLGGFLAAPVAAGFDPMSGHRPPRVTVAEFAMVGFRLDRTLSEHGAVSRGVCTVNYGKLSGIVEQTGILAAEVGAGRKFSGEETVSMNCWGFTPAVFAGLDAQFREFMATKSADPKAEFYLPAAVAGMVGRGEATVRVLPTASTWFGVTYREDKPRVQAAILELVAIGAYPTKLF
ncbi:MAG: NTP transferase domain-containing protein [Undibacterium sp.]|nr:NTP transferase domain-containing protein [Opitutaceae bacterium]